MALTDLEGNPFPDGICPIHLSAYEDGFDCTTCTSIISNREATP